ncbi:histone-fold-containing protein [Martensiomyces pterosporus]|nr:histone-fold-containing protein [Martensiomyces pterosporus]
MSTIEDLDFPKAVLTRIIKATIPENISIQKDARQAVTKAATVFVSYLAATANDCARESGHKTIMANDVFMALEAVGLSDFIERLKADLEAHTAIMKEKKELAQKNKLNAEAGAEDSRSSANQDATAEGEEVEEDEVDEGHDEVEDNEDKKDGSEQTDGKAEEAGAQSSKSLPVTTKPDGDAPEAMDVDDSEADHPKRPRIE